MLFHPFTNVEAFMIFVCLTVSFTLLGWNPTFDEYFFNTIWEPK